MNQRAHATTIQWICYGLALLGLCSILYSLSLMGSDRDLLRESMKQELPITRDQEPGSNGAAPPDPRAEPLDDRVRRNLGYIGDHRAGTLGTAAAIASSLLMFSAFMLQHVELRQQRAGDLQNQRLVAASEAIAALRQAEEASTQEVRVRARTRALPSIELLRLLGCANLSERMREVHDGEPDAPKVDSVLVAAEKELGPPA